MLGSGSIAWCSQRQKCVALSTTESEYIAASEAVKELVWIKRLLSDLLMKKSFVPKMYTWTIKARSDLLKMLSSAQTYKAHRGAIYHYIREQFENHSFGT